MRFVASLTLLSLLSLSAASPANSAGIPTLPENNPTYRQVQNIYRAVARSFGEGRLPPRLVVIPAGSKSDMVVAWSEAGSENSLGLAGTTPFLQEGYIAIEERTITLLQQLGSDRDNGIAFLLAHELAHYYQRHGWTGDFGNAFVGMEVGKKILTSISADEVVRAEAEADHLGGFYGYLAGYDTLGAAPRTLDILYSAYKLPDKLENYPSRGERKAIAVKAGENLQRLVPVFEAGNSLLVVGRYEDAGRIFEHLAHTFPSREMFLNAGVAYAQAAIVLFPPDALRFAYPLAFDADTRLTGARERRRGSDELAERREEMLNKAQEFFEEAIRRDRTYVIAHVDLASVFSLKGDQEGALLVAKKGLDMATKSNDQLAVAHARVVRGIAYALSDEGVKAAAEFDTAGDATPLTALNLAVLAEKENPPATSRIGEIRGTAKETIGGISPWDNFKKDKITTSYTLMSQVSGQGDMVILSRQGKEWRQQLVKKGKSMLHTVTTGKGYQTKNAQGIAVGAPAATLKDKYGAPVRFVPALQSTWHVYPKAGTAFAVDGAGKVAGWMLFAGE